MKGPDELDEQKRSLVRSILVGFGIASARRVTGTDPTEEVLLLGASEFAKVDAAVVELAVMDALPHTKVWVIEEHESWESEQL